MFCTNCGNAMIGNAGVCLKCGFRANTARNHCYQCGVSVHAGQEMCVSCGVNLRYAPPSSYPAQQNNIEVIVPPLVSFFITGVGQMINRQFAKGITMLVVSFLSGIIGIFLIFPLLFSFAIWVISIIDAYMIAQKIRNGKRVDEWEMF